MNRASLVGVSVSLSLLGGTVVLIGQRGSDPVSERHPAIEYATRPTSRIQGNSGFAEKFTAAGPRDAKGRSLRELDLEKRLLKYPCSYMIYSAGFEGLPARAKNTVHDRLWQVLSGAAQDKAYARLSSADRRAIIEILRDTKKDLPASFR